MEWVKRDKMLCRSDGLTIRRRADGKTYSLELGFPLDSGHRLNEQDVFAVLRALPASAVVLGAEPGWLHLPRWNGMRAAASFFDPIIARRALSTFIMS